MSNFNDKLNEFTSKLFKMTENKKGKLASILSSIICVICGLIIGFIILLIIDAQNAGNIFLSIICGGFADPKGWVCGFGKQLVYTAPLLMCGLSILFAYKTGMFNIGVAGQFTVGAFGALLCAIVFKWNWFFCMLAAAVFGAIWGALPGLLKAFFKVNEVITCIMLNWIALYMVNDLMQYKIKLDMYLGTTPVTSMFFNSKTLNLASVNKDSIFPKLGLDQLFSTEFATIAIPIAIIVTIIVFVLLSKTTFGYELKACGLNKNAAEYAGIKGKRNIIVSMAIAGALAGIGASLLYQSNIEQFPQTTTALSGLAFNGIPVAFIGSLNPFGTMFASFFVSHIQQGAGLLTGSNYSSEMSSIFTGVIIYFCAFAPLVTGLVRKYIFKSSFNDKSDKLKEDKPKNENNEPPVLTEELPIAEEKASEEEKPLVCETTEKESE